jgi:hypothetical protein
MKVIRNEDSAVKGAKRRRPYTGKVKKPALLLSLTLLAAAGLRAEAAVVYLKDGSRLSGTVVGATARDIQLYTPDGTLRISTDRIASIDYQGASAPAGAAGPAAPQPPAPVYQPERAARSRFARGERETPGPNAVSLDMGIAAPLSDIDFHPLGGGSASNGDVGAGLGLQYLRYVDAHWAFGADFQWLDRSETDSFGLLSNAHAHVSGDSVVFLGLFKYDILTQGDARPYVAAGAGFHSTNETIDARPDQGFVWSDTLTDEHRRLVDDTQTGPAGTVRLGVDFYVIEPSVLSFEAGWTALGGATYHATGQGKNIGVDGVSGPVHILTILFKWGWRF